jgi:hypothetical protein
MAYRSVFQDAIDRIGVLLDDEKRRPEGRPADSRAPGGPQGHAGGDVRVEWRLVDHPLANGGGRTDYGEPNQSLIVTAHIPEDHAPRDLMAESLQDLARYSLLSIPLGRAAGTGARGARSVAQAARRGQEIEIGKNLRIAPFGNRTGHRTGKYPHYHRRSPLPGGGSAKGQGIDRHRPWDSKPSDRKWWDRF